MCYRLQLHQYHLNGEALLPVCFCLIWFKVTIFFYRWLNIKAATAYYPVIQTEVNDPLPKDTIEPLSGGAGFYWNMFVVPKHTGG